MKEIDNINEEIEDFLNSDHSLAPIFREMDKRLTFSEAVLGYLLKNFHDTQIEISKKELADYMLNAQGLRLTLLEDSLKYEFVEKETDQE